MAAPAEVSHPVGARLELEAGPVAHGGHVVARTDEGQVVFVRHALPGERVVVEVTETPSKKGGSFLRADAVEVLTPSPHRVAPPCPYAGPGRCGGCDFQHVDLAEQRRLKAAVVEEQLRRLAGIERQVEVELVRADPALALPDAATSTWATAAAACASTARRRWWRSTTA